MLDTVYDIGDVVLFRFWRGSNEVFGCATVTDRDIGYETRASGPVEWYAVTDGVREMVVRDTNITGKACLLEAMAQFIP